jgi:hypothetical protein
MVKKIIGLVIVLVVIGAALYGKPFLIQSNEHPELSMEQFNEQFPDVAPPTFKEAPVAHSHQKNDGAPFLGSALIDIDNDGVDEVFIGGGAGQADALLKYQDGGFINILPAPEDLSGKLSSLGAVSVDIDDDGDIDIIVARPDDLYLLINNEGSGFTEAHLNMSLPEKTVPFSVAAGDINKDGVLDLYVSTFIDMEHLKAATFNDPDHKTQNFLLIGNKEEGLIDMTAASGLVFKQNTFISSFVDLDNDGWQDLVIAPNTDTVRIFKNIEGKNFEEQESPSGYGFWMGMAIADLDNDGDQDLYFSNSGNTLPDSVSQGDLLDSQKKEVDWIVLENEGDFKFKKTVLKDYEFAWGASMTDLNNDGSKELIVAENYLKWLAHKLSPLSGRILMQDAEKNWQPITEVTGALNPSFGMTPLISDWNRDGYPDIFYVNLNGPSMAYLSEGGEANFIKVIMPDTAASLGAVVTVDLGDGQVMKQQFLSSTGFLSDPSTILIFGLGDVEQVEKVTVDWPSGKQTVESNPSINSRIFAEEK